jgi:ferredoxin
MCTDVCPHGVFILENGKAAITDRDACMECGACEKNCPFTAVEVKTGVGCAAAVMNGLLTGEEPSCGCSTNDGCC